MHQQIDGSAGLVSLALSISWAADQIDYMPMDNTSQQETGEFRANYASRFKYASFKARVEKTGDLDISDGDGRTALFIAARLGRKEHLDLLLKRGADPNITDATDEAPLQVAARYGYVDCVRALISADAQIDHVPSPLKSRYPETALCSAVRKQKKDVVFVLLEAKADPNIRAQGGLQSFPLWAAAWEGQVDMISRLLAAGADPNMGKRESRIALHCVAQSGKLEALRCLLEGGADPDIQDNQGSTVAMEALCAALENHDAMPMLFEILKAKPNLQLRDNIGRTVLSLALEEGLMEEAALLKGAGAKMPPKTVRNDLSCEGIDDGVEMRYEIKDSSLPRPTAEDIAMNRRLCETTPVIIAHHEWTSSPRHWVILEVTSEPLSLDRIAYFVRGYFNRPKGQEMQDGKKYLGEDYETAVNRFVELGYLSLLDETGAALRNSTVVNLKAITRRLGLRGNGNKTQLLDLIGKHSPDEIEQLASKKTWYIRTPVGDDMHKKLGGQDSWRSARGKPKSDYVDQLFETLCERNLEGALMLYLELLSSQSESRYMTPQIVCNIRTLLERPIPNEIEYVEKEELSIRAAAAVSELFSTIGYDEFDRWPRWGVETAPYWSEDEINEKQEHSPQIFGFWLLHETEG